MAGKSVEERLVELENRKKQIEAQQQALLTRLKDKERKERTRRLIQLGAKMESLGMKTLEQGDAFIAEIKSNEKARDWFNKIIGLAQDQDPSAKEDESLINNEILEKE